MNSEFKKRYAKLNAGQKRAVDNIDGPMLVVAGPGTGKTELLSVRTANILKQGQVGPSNILCLTFTDNAARNMRERLEQIAGQASYHVAIHTFHSFAVEVFNQYPDMFSDRPLLQPVDELGRYELLREIFDDLPASDPLSTKVDDEYIYLKDTKDIIGWLKQNALQPKELKQVLDANKKVIDQNTKLAQETFAQSPLAKLLPVYKKLHKNLEKSATNKPFFGVEDYGSTLAAELALAIDVTDPSGRFATPITAWRTRWLEKDEKGQYQFKDARRSMLKMQAVVKIYARLQERLTDKGLYDFDDMVIELVKALETNQELKLNLQERYQYILVDEFQDTNKAQLRILSSLGDNSVNEGRPNIMVVGDPKQAIFAFQGAENSNIDTFLNSYRDVEVVSLSDNYRSTQTILDASHSVLDIDQRLRLVARAEHKQEIIEHNVLPSELQQYHWVAEKINEYLAQGFKPADIGVIAPKHRYLERLMPYLANASIPVAYERRENILEAPLVVQLLLMSELVEAIAENDQAKMDELFSEVLSYEFWGLPLEGLIEIAGESYDERKHWLGLLLKSKNRRIKQITQWFLALARHVKTEPLEYILDQLIGSSKEKFISPFKAYYFDKKKLDSAPDEYLVLLGQLSSLRHNLRGWKPERTLYLKDLIEFAALHKQAGLKIVDTNPHTQTTNAVQVMTAYKAKGLEFGVVFVLNAQDEVWGPSAKSKSSKIRLPGNLAIKPAGGNDDEKLRLFFVSLTRAKQILHLASYERDLDNKLSLGLSFIGGNSKGAQPVHESLALKFINRAENTKALEILSTDWAQRYKQILADKPALFEPILKRYRLNVTHLNNFLDIMKGGPQYFLLHNLLRFPEAISPNAAYGDAIHKTMEFIYDRLKRDEKLPTLPVINGFFEDVLGRKHLKPSDHKRFSARGELALKNYLKERAGSFDSGDIIERGFANEGVVVGGARLGGKIDKLMLVSSGNFKVVDYKTGNPVGSWNGKTDFERIKMHKYQQQLMFYKLLVEGSASFGRKYQVISAAIEFIEPDKEGKLIELLEMEFDQKELDRFKSLVAAVWQHIMNLDFVDVSAYQNDLKGVKQFEDDLISGKV